MTRQTCDEVDLYGRMLRGQHEVLQVAYILLLSDHTSRQCYGDLMLCNSVTASTLVQYISNFIDRIFFKLILSQELLRKCF
jgi:hypothetical protein